MQVILVFAILLIALLSTAVISLLKDSKRLVTENRKLLTELSSIYAEFERRDRYGLFLLEVEDIVRKWRKSQAEAESKVRVE